MNTYSQKSIFIVAWTALILALVLAVVVSTAFPTKNSIGSYAIDGAEILLSDQSTESDADEAINAQHVTLNFGEAQIASENNTVSKRITATVYPANAPDKSIDWSVSWNIPIENAEVTDYVTVTPDADGSLGATVTAHQGFEGATIFVTATTRVGGFSASCLVVYEGAPERLNFLYDGQEYTSTSSIELVAGTQNEIDMVLSNQLGAVGSNYGNYTITSIKGSGRFIIEKQTISNGECVQTEDITFDLSSNSYSIPENQQYSMNAMTFTIDMSQFFTASLSGSALTINALENEAAYQSARPRYGYFFKYKAAYTNTQNGAPENCFWSVYVKDNVSGKTCLINIDITSTVQSVAVSDSYMSF